MRRSDRSMPVEFAIQIIDECEYAVLATVCQDGAPYCVPVSIVRDEQRIFFHCAKEGKKTDNILHDQRVCISCVGKTNRLKDAFTTEYESAIISGTAWEVTAESEKIDALRLLCQRHTPENMQAFDQEIARSLQRTAVWAIDMQEITGKRKKYDQNGVEMKYGREA